MNKRLVTWLDVTEIKNGTALPYGNEKSGVLTIINWDVNVQKVIKLSNTIIKSYFEF